MSFPCSDTDPCRLAETRPLRGRRRSGVLQIAVGIVLTTPSARADRDLEPIRLVYDAAAACPNVDKFLAEVRRAAPRLRVTSGDESVRLFTVRLQMESVPRGRLSITKNGAILGARNVEGKTCDDVASILAFAVALAIDPNAGAPIGAREDGAAAAALASPRAPASGDAPQTLSSEPSRETARSSAATWWGVSARALAALRWISESAWELGRPPPASESSTPRALPRRTQAEASGSPTSSCRSKDVPPRGISDRSPFAPARASTGACA
jgi:hypothetical protein